MRKLGLALLLIIVAQPVMHAGSAETSSLHVQCAPASQSLLHLIQASPALSSCFTGCTQSESSCQFSGSVASLCCRPARVQTTAWKTTTSSTSKARSAFQRMAIHRRGDPLGGALVSPVPDQLSRSRTYAA